MAHRKSRRTTEPAVLIDPADDPDRLVVEVAAEFGTEFEAGLAAARSNDPFPSREPGLVRNVVFVRKSDLERAREVLATPVDPL
jgi:hypothetical protein